MTFEDIDERLFLLIANKLNIARMANKISAESYTMLMLDYNIALYYNDVVALQQIAEQITRIEV